MKYFICKRCGFCCKGESTVALSPEEVEIIAQYLSLKKEEFTETFTTFKAPNRIEMKTRNGYCIFYDDKNKLCLIHPVKPERCKEWPFPRGIFLSEENFMIIKSSCPGLENFSFEDIMIRKT